MTTGDLFRVSRPRQEALRIEPEARHVEVAIPVPLRRRFTYRVPPSLVEQIAVGTRVAVPFSGRKLAGFVIGWCEPPAGVTRMRDVAGVLDPEPIFPPELFSFLVEAGEYYLHPIGEVLRAAAPALRTEALRSLRATGFLDATETLPGARVGMRTVLMVKRAAQAPLTRPRLGPRQRELLAIVEERGEVSIDELRGRFPQPRAVIRSLATALLVETEEREVPADPFFAEAAPAETPPEPNAAQREAIAAIRQAILQRRDDAFLLHGVTGSGKTEVYLRVIAEARAQNRGALLLVPEISLTPQLVARFRARFGDAIAVLHSGLGDRERHESWQSLRRGAVGLAIGARSALFAPVESLGVIVVDEEHDPSFKQEEGFRYQARDLALLRAKRAGAVCILGSATPSLESFHGAERGRLRLLSLPDRATAHRLPEVEIVDLDRNRGGPSGNPYLTAPLHRALEKCLGAGDQAILFLNRRGFAPSVRCRACGVVARCPACSVALTEHRRAGMLRCHYCEFTTRTGDACPTCGALALERIGVGTEKLEETIAEVFAPARVARLDRDTATASGIESVLERLRRREVDVLVGTQMVTKGHDLPGVTVVGVILADQSLAFPDFRAEERTFQLLAQVAGRAGRGERPGRVVLQTFQPDHHAIRRAAAHDYLGFYREELEKRRDLYYPPFGRVVAVRVDAGDAAQAERAAQTLAAVACAHPAVATGPVRVFGPAPAPIARLRARYRYRLLLRSPDRRALRTVAATVADRIDEGLSPARATIDIDPVSML